jgi:hypothetical protein
MSRWFAFYYMGGFMFYHLKKFIILTRNFSPQYIPYEHNNFPFFCSLVIISWHSSSYTLALIHTSLMQLIFFLLFIFIFIFIFSAFIICFSYLGHYSAFGMRTWYSKKCEDFIKSFWSPFQLQWKQLNVITNNIIIWLT